LSEERQLVLVTGANGFVGSHLVEALLNQGYAVRCMVRRSSDLVFLRDLPVEWAYASLEEKASLRQACSGVDAVCHLAALTRALDEETFKRINTQGTLDLAEACMEEAPDLKRFLFVSSLAACGPAHSAQDRVDELCRSEPVTWYGKSKLEAEQALLALENHLPVTIVRAAPVLGPRDRDFLTYFDLVHRGLDLQLGREERWASIIYVHDLVRLLVTALENAKAVGELFFGCGQATSYADLAASIARALGKQPWRVTLPLAVLTPIAWSATIQGRLTGKPALLNDQRVRDLRQPYWLCSDDKARRELGFEPQYDLATAVQETADWYLENGWMR
jgi:nucleoside-diphosphate-sugar epimerase